MGLAVGGPGARGRMRILAALAATMSAAMSEHVPVRGLFEAHLTVSELGRAVAFYRDVVGLAFALEVPERGAAFLRIGGPGQGMLGLWSLRSAPMGLSLHVAFRTSLNDVLERATASARAASQRSTARSSRLPHSVVVGSGGASQRGPLGRRPASASGPKAGV